MLRKILSFGCLSLVLFSFEAFAVKVKENANRFGIRLEVGANPYVSIDIDKLSANNPKEVIGGVGLAVPLRLEGTYNITGALEVLLGFDYIPTAVQFSGTDKYAMQYSGFAGLRYYINTEDPVKLYGAVRGHFAFDKLNGQVDLSAGLQFYLMENADLFLQMGLAPAIAQYAYIQNDFMVGFPISIGAQYRF